MGLLHTPTPQGLCPYLLAQCLRRPVATCPKGCRARRKSSHGLSSLRLGFKSQLCAHKPCSRGRVTAPGAQAARRPARHLAPLLTEAPLNPRLGPAPPRPRLHTLTAAPTQPGNRVQQTYKTVLSEQALFPLFISGRRAERLGVQGGVVFRENAEPRLQIPQPRCLHRAGSWALCWAGGARGRGADRGFCPGQRPP